MTRFTTFVLLSILLPGAVAAQTAPEAYFRTEGTAILGPDGEPVVLRGLGLGGWLMPEGYMLHTPGFGSPTQINTLVEGLIGEEDAERFWELYVENYVEEKDVAAIAEWGFDHLRLPFHYKVLYDTEADAFREEGFELVDRFIDWCKTYGLYVVLDMHAAPGGQNHGNISDSDGTARLWTGPTAQANQDLTVAIWEEIARRYKDEKWIVGYDLINEPVLPDGVTNADLRALYVRLTEAIRPIDPDHILFIEGNWYATDFAELTPPWDDNLVYAFHKYWNGTSQSTFQYLLDLREEHQVPLWLGESGENSNEWFFEVTRLMESLGIGWNWWTHKKIGTVTSPLSAEITPRYRQILNYWGGTAARPSANTAREALFDMAMRLDMDSCVFRPDVVAALLDPDYAERTRPYAEHVIPGAINAVDYDIGSQGLAYSDRAFKNESGTPGLANNGGAYRNDGVDIEASADPLGFAYNVGWTEPREWLEYTVTIAQAGTYDLAVRVASHPGGGSFDVLLDGERIAENIAVPQTGGWQIWRTVSVPGLVLPAGEHRLRVLVDRGDFNLNRLVFTPGTTTPAEPKQGPWSFRLEPSYPNPFNPDTTIEYVLATPGPVRLDVFDVRGRRVATLAHGMLPAGEHRARFEAGDLPSGTYFVRLQAEGLEAVRPVTLLK